MALHAAHGAVAELALFIRPQQCLAFHADQFMPQALQRGFLRRVIVVVIIIAMIIIVTSVVAISVQFLRQGIITVRI